jgi:GNAT superfamily N-acetyltransferase
VSKPQLRRATSEDAPLIASVLRQSFAEYEPLYTKEGYAATTPEPEDIRIRMEGGPVWIAVYDLRIAGTASVIPKPKGIYVRGMAVVPCARGLGIGQLLLDEIQRFAATGGCERIFLRTTPFLNRAIRLYQAFGFQRADDGPRDLFGTPLFTMEKILPVATLGWSSRK